MRGVDGHRRRGGCGPRCSRRGEQGADIRGENRPISHIAPYWPMEAPTTASGSAAIAFCPEGLDSQSIAFLSPPGVLPLCSGVTNRIALASATGAAQRASRRG